MSLTHALDGRVGIDAVRFIDIEAPGFDPGSHEVAEARREHWYARTSLGSAVLRYAEAARLLKDQRLRPASRETLLGQGVSDGLAARWWLDALLNTMDGADHTRLRGLVAPAFTARRSEVHAAAVRARVHAAIDQLDRGGSDDLIAQLCDPVPLAAICDVLAVPEPLRQPLTGWADHLGYIFNLGVTEYLTQIEVALSGLRDGVEELMAYRRRNPGGDLVSRLVSAGDRNDGLTISEAHDLVVELLFASTTTTRNQFARALVLFAENPEAWDQLGRDPSLGARAVEEILRLVPTMPAMTRIAREDISINGETFVAGTFFLIAVAVAHTDPAVFSPTGLSLAVDRQPQLTFGGGPHRCLGAQLARVTMREAFVVMAERLPHLRLVGDLTWRPPVGLSGPHHLPMRWDIPRP